MKKERKMPPHGHGAQKVGQHSGQPHKHSALQGKSAMPARVGPPPATPPVYRPQPVPKILQGKVSAPHQAVTPLKRPLVAPPVYRPQPLPQVLQRKAAGGQPPRADQSSRRPVAPPVYRPDPKALSSKTARPQAPPTPTRPLTAFPPASAKGAPAKNSISASKSLQPSQRSATRMPGVAELLANKSRIVQAKMVHLSGNYVALDEDPESILNDGDEKYQLEHSAASGERHLLKDNWGDVWIYDSANGSRSRQNPAGHSEDITDYLLVDCHLVHPTLRPDLEVDRMPFKSVLRVRWTGDANGSMMSIDYGFGNWTVSVYWPSKWLLRGDNYAPAPNRLGLVPAGEFGISNWSGGSTSMRPHTRVAPFPYRTVGGVTYTPEAAFVNNEIITKEHWVLARESLTKGKDYMIAIAPIVLANRRR